MRALMVMIDFVLFLSLPVSNARISPEMMGFVRKLVSTFGIGLEQTTGSNSNSVGPISHEALAKRAQAVAQDPAFQRLKAQFASDFDFTSLAAQRVHNLMAKLKKWIKILELKIFYSFLFLFSGLHIKKTILLVFHEVQSEK